MRETVLTLTALMIPAAACAQLDGDPDDEVPVAMLAIEAPDSASPHRGVDGPTLEPQVDDDQGCVGEVLRMTFTQTSAIATGKVECLKGGMMQFKMCIRRRLIQSAASRLWGIAWSPAGSIKKTFTEEVVGTEDCVETAKQEYQAPPPGTTFWFELTADVFCGELGTRYSYEPSLQGVKDFHSWTELFLGDNWNTLARGPMTTRICGATWP